MAALSLGLGVDLSPGSLLVLLISQTLSSGLGAGLKVALVPLLTDGPIINLIYYVFKIRRQNILLIGLISFTCS